MLAAATAALAQSRGADKKDESPILSMFTAEQERQKAAWRAEIKSLEEKLEVVTPELLAGQKEWEAEFPWEEVEYLLTPERVLRAIASDPIAGAMFVRVSARNRIVHLASGDSNAEQRDRVMNVVRRVPGVAGVEDDMK